MPGRSKASRYSTEQNVNFITRTLAVLEESAESMTIQQIQSEDMILNELSSQKMARVLSELAEMGMIIKNKGAQGRMCYKIR